MKYLSKDFGQGNSDCLEAVHLCVCDYSKEAYLILICSQYQNNSGTSF